jgi:serine/threonine-protein kinase RsbW
VKTNRFIRHLTLDESEQSAIWMVVPADPRELDGLRDTTCRFASEHGLTPARCRDMALALTEACANVVLHAYPATRRAGNEPELLVDLATGPDGVTVHVCDSGVGVDAASDRHGLGLGVDMIRVLADDVAVRSTPGVGTCVRMRFRRSRRRAKVDR